jgi:16S rRNA (cytosine967-C5)-methyltransferase
VAAFVQDSDYKVHPLDLEGVRSFVTPGGFLRLTPRTAGTDGFFAAMLVKA